MANKYDDADGVWRTIGGRRVFIREGQSLSDAMKASGKFKKKNEESKDDFDDEAYKKRFKSGGDFAFAQENHKTGLEGLDKTAKEEENKSTYEDREEMMEKLAKKMDKLSEQGKDDTEEFRKLEKQYDDLMEQNKDEDRKFLNENKNEFYKKLTNEEKKKYEDYLEKGYSKSDIENTLMYKTQEERMKDAGIEFVNKDREFLNESNSNKNTYEDREVKMEKLAERMDKLSDEGKDNTEEFRKLEKEYDDLLEQNKDEDREFLDNDYKDDFYNKLSDEQKKVVDNAYKEGKKQYEEEKRVGEEYGKKLAENSSTSKIDYSDEDKIASIEKSMSKEDKHKLKELYADRDGIPRSASKARERVQKEIDNLYEKYLEKDNSSKNKYVEYYKKENLGEPSNYQKGDNIEYKSSYGENVKGTVVREATNEEKEGHINTNLKGYIVKDANGNESVVADTKINKNANENFYKSGNTYWNGKGKYKDYVASIENKTDAELSEMGISKGLIKQYRDEAHKYYRWFNDGDKPHKQTLDGKTYASADYLYRGINSQSERDYWNEVYGNDMETRMNNILEKMQNSKKTSMNDKIRNEAFKKYKKEHPGSKMTLNEFLKK